MLSKYKYIITIKNTLNQILLKTIQLLSNLKKEKKNFLKRSNLLTSYHTAYSKKIITLSKSGINGQEWKTFYNFLNLLEKNIKLEKEKIYAQNKKIQNIQFKYIKIKQKIEAWKILEKNKKLIFLQKKTQLESVQNDFFLQLTYIKNKLKS